MRSAIRINTEYSFFQKIMHLNWGLIVLITAIACVGFTALYSAAGGSLSPWAIKQMVRFVFGFFLMCAVALTDVKWWYRLAWPAFIGSFVLLIIVELMGHIGMGAQRWINLGFIQIQPSELMKISVVMILSRYFHILPDEDVTRIRYLVFPAFLIACPVGLILLQPDLGTSLMISMVGAGMFFIVGAPLWIFISGAVAIAVSVPIAWQFLHDYQKQRVLTFMNPESDPLGSGYHIMQSKIALGSGGVQGKGFLQGSQSHLNFLPEKQTDFIFTLWAEEWGLMGGVFLLALFGLVFMYGAWIAMNCRHAFGRYLAFGLTINFSLYVLMNVAMVMGVIPVVGEPLPLVSYGGTVMITIMIGFGMLMSCSLYRDSKLGRPQ